MSTMKAALIEAQNSEFKIADIARPSPQAGQILVRIKAAALNLLDLKIRAGEAAHARHPLPAILGIDMAGIVEAVALSLIPARQPCPSVACAIKSC